MDDKEPQDYIFTDEQINNFANFYNTLKKIHTRLIKDGYIIRENEIIPPTKKIGLKFHNVL